jgi:multiple sugar transport system ATP-binding protein
MKDGDIMQVATPLELYHHPANMFVAGFIGSPPMNFLHGTIQSAGPQLVFVENNSAAAPLRIALGERLSSRAAGHIGKPIVFGLRPEDVHDALIVANPAPGTTAEVTVEVSEPMGAETYLYLHSGAHAFVARMRGGANFDSLERLKVVFQLDNAHLFDPQTELALS